MSYYREAFDMAIQDAKTRERWYVALICSYQAYGGPEEGGWWYTVGNVEAYREYASRDLAEEAAESVEKLAGELRQIAQRQHGEYCLRQMEWLDARGLDADYLPENDGPDEYRVIVCEELPTFDNRRPQYC